MKPLTQVTTISDIKYIVANFESSLLLATMETKQKIFDTYNSCCEITVLPTRLENCEGGSYSIDGQGELIYSIEISPEIEALPFVHEYLTQDFGHIAGHRKHYHLCQTMGGFISISRDHERNSYFVFDHEARKAIIEKELPWMDDYYVSAVIEKYMQEAGEFNDVVEVCPRYGSYIKHFSTTENLDEKTKKIVTESTKLDEILNALNKTINAIADANTTGEE